MRPRFYADIEISKKERGAEKSALLLVSRLVSGLHKIFHGSPGEFAIAFPKMRTGDLRHPGRKVRVFAETLENLDKLRGPLEKNGLLEEFEIVQTKSVPVDFNGEWVEYRRYRIPNNRSRLEKCRLYRFSEAESWPYLRMLSKSTGHLFSLHIARMESSGPSDCLPDSYGLSVSDRPFALPVL